MLLGVMARKRILFPEKLIAACPPPPEGCDAWLDQSPAEWRAVFQAHPEAHVLAAAIDVVERLVMPIWSRGRPQDVRPSKALEAARMFLRDGSKDAIEYAAVAAKACVAARRESLGHEHRAAEAARAIARSIGQDGRLSLSLVLEALVAVEETLSYELSVEAVYDRERAIRAAMLGALFDSLHRVPVC